MGITFYDDNHYIRTSCDTKQILLMLINDYPDNAEILINGKKALLRVDDNEKIIHLDSIDYKLPCGFDF